MIKYDESLCILEEIGKSFLLSTETVALEDSEGRILAESLCASEEVPSFTNSAMDGFAVSSTSTHQASYDRPIRLSVHGLVAAGDLNAFEEAQKNATKLGRNTSVEIMTGAPLPEESYDAVVRIEDVKVSRDSNGFADFIELNRPILLGENVRPKGTDFRSGQKLISQGVRLESHHLLVCSALGITHLQVKRLPKIVIISTGSELVSHVEKNLPPGMIRNSTGIFLVSALKQLGIEAQYLGIVRDDPKSYRAALEHALSIRADIVISTGAVSMGKFDFVSDVLNEIEAVTYFHKVGIRPGKPILFGELEGKADLLGLDGNRCAFFGLPGNPVSTAVGLRFFVEPFLRAMFGLSRETPISARLSKDCVKPEGLRCFFKGKSRWTQNGIEAEAVKGQASYVVSALLDSNCWVVFHEENAAVSAGAQVEIYPMQNGFGPTPLLI